ncbi:MAG: hypothetical protein KJO79_05345 [Verrucomicrobiae bacterium]|nr:hypothetical protein [Verrucomicrobiae bacterium]
MLYAVEGAPSVAGKPRLEELAKLLDAAARSRKSYFAMDDVGDSIHSHDLNRFISAPSYQARVMGTGSLVDCPTVCQCFATGNGLNLAADLVRRCLIVDLFCAEEATEREFEFIMTPSWLGLPSTRAKFLAASWAFVRTWIEQGLPICPDAKHNSAPEWAQVVGSILAAAVPKLRPFAARSLDNLGGGDAASDAVNHLLVTMADELRGESRQFRPVDFLDRAQDMGLYSDIVGFSKSPESTLGKALTMRVGRIYKTPSGHRFTFKKPPAMSCGVVYLFEFSKSK